MRADAKLDTQTLFRTLRASVSSPRIQKHLPTPWFQIFRKGELGLSSIHRRVDLVLQQKPWSVIPQTVLLIPEFNCP